MRAARVRDDLQLQVAAVLERELLDYGSVRRLVAAQQDRRARRRRCADSDG